MKVETYLNAIDQLGFAQTWYNIVNSPISVGCYGELYEIGLAHMNKEDKKSLGKYFTPDDVATLMSRLLVPLEGENLCDVCCGVGNLVLAYLGNMGMEDARRLVKEGRLWLYDIDGLAMKICLESICKRFGEDMRTHVHLVQGDFLSKDVHLPPNAKVISNPPYAKIEFVSSNWNQTQILMDTHELYAAIMEKILDESVSSVIITPQNYLGREKFSSLRSKLSSYSGFIVPFDNTPGQVFNGRKHGVFNTNTQNQVRPAIMVCDNGRNAKGWCVAGMVRFKNGERDRVLTPECLEGMLGNVHQTPGTGRFRKCFPSLEDVLDNWETFSKGETLGEHMSDTGPSLNFATTCRYFTVAYVSNLYRSGKREIAFKDETTRDLAYCFLNSSYCYWHWRLYDGEITYQKGMLDAMPTFFKGMDNASRDRLVEIAKEMQSLESTFVVTKKNSGKMMENIRFPEKYRQEIDGILLKSMGSGKTPEVFDILHSHSVFP